MNDNNETDPLPFIQLAAVVANVARYLLRDGKEIEREDERDHQNQSAEDRIDRPENRAFMAGAN